MARYHMKKDGTPGICNAQPGNCPFGGNDNHVEAETLEQAQQQFDNKNETEVADKLNTSKAGVTHGDEPKLIEKNTIKGEKEVLQNGLAAAGEVLENYANESPVADLQERINMAELEIEESEGRRGRFLKRYRMTGDKLLLELAQDEEKRIAQISIAISEASVKLKDEF